MKLEGENCPTVSIIMPSYNSEKYIGEAIESVQKQTVSDWELIIVDDASLDQTAGRVSAYLTDERIRFVQLEQNSGTAAVRNRALDLARGTYIAFLDSDDLWNEDKLEKQLMFIREQEEAGRDCWFTCAGYQKIDEQGEPLLRGVLPPKKTGYWKALFLSNPIGNSTVIYHRERFKDIRVPDIRKRNDFALWLAMLHNHNICYGMEEILASYRVRKNSISAHKLPLIKYHWILYRKIEKLPAPVALTAVLCWAFVKGTGIGVHKKKWKEVQTNEYV